MLSGFGQSGNKFFSVFHTGWSSNSKSLAESVTAIIRFLCSKTLHDSKQQNDICCSLRGTCRWDREKISNFKGIQLIS